MISRAAGEGIGPNLIFSLIYMIAFYGSTRIEGPRADVELILRLLMEAQMKQVRRPAMGTRNGYGNLKTANEEA